ncbi:MAG: phosphate/phosphite/phosphonate ABC transporter substrate-binding protein, partial [Spirochaetia bacterium]|nr:phosphate/phosphite/phosphonate ABC transporter substrate-binding protein [Spirochaetia bacterium]
MLIFFNGSAYAHEFGTRIGILDEKSFASSKIRWEPFAEYLSKEMGLPVYISVLNFNELNSAITENKIDFVLTNPAHYLHLKSLDLQPHALATLVEDASGRPAGFQGATIIVRNERNDILSLEDLKGRQIASYLPYAMWAYMMPLYELKQADIDRSDIHLMTDHSSPENIVREVLEGRADAGFLPAGLFEQMIDKGILNENSLKVLNRRPVDDFPYAVSTRLYPEWSFIALAHLDSSTTLKITSLLLSIKSGSP